MKKTYLAALAALMIAGQAAAQQYRTAYFMEGAPQRSALNPALRPDRGYVMIPGIGNLQVNLNSNSLTLNTFLYPNGTDGRLVTLLDKRVTWPEIAPHLKEHNDVGVDFSLPILGAGFYTGRGFWTVGITMNGNSGFSLPRSLVEFAKLGSRANAYDMSGLSLGANLSTDLSLGYSHRITDELTVGGRVNFKAGLARAMMNYDQLDLTLNGDRWAVDAVGTAEMSLPVAFDMRYNDDGSINIDETLDSSIESLRFGFAGFGMTFDLGAEYVLLDRFRFSAALLNLGFMNWKPANSFTGTATTSYEFEGVQTTFNPDTQEWETSDMPEMDMEKLFNFRETNAKSRTKIYPGVTLGVEYDIFGNNLLNAGALFTHRSNEFAKRTEFSLSATVRPTDWFTASLSWCIGNFRNIGDNFFNSFGFALNFHPKWINFFIGTDFLMFRFAPQGIPLNQRSMNVSVGFSVPFKDSRYGR